jgi:hypothetical protein
MATGRTQSGTTADGSTWEAVSNIVGQTGTGTAAANPPGNPIYYAPSASGYSGVVGLRMQYATGAFVCTGSLIGGNRIVTAAHCVSDGFANDVNGRAPGLISTTAFFYDGVSQGVDPFFYPINAAGDTFPGITKVTVGAYHINAGYTGEVIDQNDIAVLTLSSAAPKTAQAYGLYTNDILGATFNVAGIGTRSLTGGVDGTTGPGAGAGPGRIRQGLNTYDLRLGEFYSSIGGTAAFQYSYLSDFDNGTTANDTGCRSFGRCHTGLGAREVSIAPGDSGGPGFINGQIASINSYGLTFGTQRGDIKAGLQSSFGEFNGFVPVFIHAGFIGNVPEPSTWALLILGFGVAGAAMRRKGKLEARYAF